MNSSFMLELDTSGPEIEVYSPKYTLNGIKTEIRIISNEKLSPSDNEIYIIDFLGNKHNFIFSLENDNELIGEIYLNIPVGSAKLYIQVKDEVLNLSPLITKGIEILSNSKIKIVSNKKEFKKSSAIKLNKINNSINIGKINYTINERKINLKNDKYKITISNGVIKNE